MLLTSDHLNCGKVEVLESLMVWVGDNKRNMVEMVVQIMDTSRFGLLE